MANFTAGDKVKTNYNARLQGMAVTAKTEGEVVSVYPGTAYPYAVRFPGSSRPVLMQAVELSKVEQPVTMTLSPAQARALRHVLGRVGGAPESTMRGLTDQIMQTLNEAGYTHNEDSWGILTGSLTFQK